MLIERAARNEAHELHAQADAKRRRLGTCGVQLAQQGDLILLPEGMDESRGVVRGRAELLHARVIAAGEYEGIAERDVRTDHVGNGREQQRDATGLRDALGIGDADIGLQPSAGLHHIHRDPNEDAHHTSILYTRPMSRIGLIVALAATGVLALAAILVLRRPAGVIVPGPLLEFSPSRAMTLEFRPLDGPGTRVERQRDGGWTLAPIDHPDDAWPASDTRVHAALRILSLLNPSRAADEGPASASEVRLTLDDGATLSLRVACAALAGQVLAESPASAGRPARRGWVSSDLASMIRDVPAWRETAALAGIGPDTSRITLHGASGMVSLARVQGKWALREPLAAPAEPETVAKLVSRLASVRIEEFLAGAAPAEARLESPQARAVLESDVRDPGDAGKVMTVRRALSIGRAKDLASKSLYARIEGVGPAPRDVLISSATLAELTTDASAYLARATLAAPVSEIGSLTLTSPRGWSRRYTRTLDGWEMLATPGEAMAAKVPDRDAVLNALLDVLAGPCERLAIAPGESTDAAAARLEIASVGGAPIATVALAVMSAEGKPAELAITNGRVVRTYPTARVGEIVGLLEKR